MRLRSPLDERSRIFLGHLQSGDSTREEYVRSALAEMDPDEAVGMLMSWREMARRGWATLPLVGVTGILSAILAVWVANLIGGPPGHISYGGVGGIGVIPVIITALRLHLLNENVVRMLSRYDDLRILDPLIASLRTDRITNHGPSEMPVLRLLAKLTPQHGSSVSKKSRSILNKLLVESREKALVLAILAAWEQVGDEEAVPVVERLAHGNAFLGNDFEVRRAAAEALPAVRESANRATISETLLRPADADETTALLRPAASSDTPEDALLRPAVE